MVENQNRHDVIKKLAARFRWACDDPREIERRDLRYALRESRTFLDVPESLRERIPFWFRSVAPIVLRRQLRAYRLNLFEVRHAT